MFGNGVVVVDGLDHLDVELFLSVRESGFKDHKVVAVEVGFEVDALGESRHFASCQVDSALDLASAVAELEDV